MNYYEHHLGDYDKATAHLSACEDGIYCRLIRRYYDTEEAIQDDIKAVQRLVRARSREEKEAVATILGEFFSLSDDGRWHHKRCDFEIAKYQDKQSKARASAQARWNRTDSEGNANASPDAMRTDSEGNAHQSPVTKVHPISSSLRSEEISPSPPGKKITFKTWLAAVKSAGGKPISTYRPVWAYAEKVGIDPEWVQIAWLKFAARYRDPNNARKKYIDWPLVFLNAVEGNWFKLWYAKDGKFQLSTVGVQADLATQEAA